MVNCSEIIFILVTRTLECIFVLLEYSVDEVSKLYNVFCKAYNTSDNSSSNNTPKTVVIVGGSFAGLAALQELAFGESSNIRIVVIDQKNFFEYTPGVLRLFCDPSQFLTSLGREFDANRYTKNVMFLHGEVTAIHSDTNGLSYIPYNETTTMNLQYDYLIYAAGSTHTYPITASSDERTLLSREEGWIAANRKIKSSQKIVILGAGAVGTELAAEIIDYFPNKEVTLIDASPIVVPLFPKSTQEYAQRWLQKKGVRLLLGKSLDKWDDKSCQFKDGTILQADAVYVCFGGKPNSKPASTQNKSMFTMNGRKSLLVDQYLLCSNNTNIFSCGDVAYPPTEALAQGFHAEIQGIVAAKNVLATIHSSVSINNRMTRYPHDICKSSRMPLVYVLSLGKYDGVLGFNNITIPGSIAAIFKWILEYTKVLQMEGKLLGRLIWKFGDAAALFLSRTIVRPPPMP